jgi:hypothetical protein
LRPGQRYSTRDPGRTTCPRGEQAVDDIERISPVSGAKRRSATRGICLRCNPSAAQTKTNTMNVATYRKPRFIKKEQCDIPIKLAITGAEEVTYSRSGIDAEFKIVIDLENEIGDKFKLSLNSGNLETIAKLFGDETDGWIGQEIGLKHDPTIKYKDEVRGGIVVIPAEEVPEKPTVEPAAPPEKPRLTVKRKLQNPAEVRVPLGRTVDDDGEKIPF